MEKWKSIKNNRHLLFLLAVASLVRFLFLDWKVPHFDEGVNGWFVDQLISNGYYQYDPTNYHGPLHFYLLWISKLFLGRNLWALRLPSVLAGILTVYWLTKFERFFSRRAVFIAAWAMALSPGFMFYTRYAIHESEFVFFQVLMLWGVLGLISNGTRNYLWALGIGITGLILTKETYVIHLGCLVLAWICLRVWEKYSPSDTMTTAKAGWTWDDMGWVVAASLGLLILFYTGGLLYPQGINGIYQAMAAWFSTGVKGNGHDKPFVYWASLFARYEWPAVLGGLSALSLILPKTSRLARMLAIYGLGVFLAYSIVPYKTPWCIVSLLWPFYLTLGYFVGTQKKEYWKDILCWGTLAGSTFLMVKLNFYNFTNEEEPYVYVHTYQEYETFYNPVLELAERDPANYNMKGNLLVGSNWPTPWLLGDFTAVNYFGGGFPSQLDADFILVDKDRSGWLENRLTGKYFSQNVKVRNAQGPARIYFSYDKFKEYFPGRDPEFSPRPKEPLQPGQGLRAKYFPGNSPVGKPEEEAQVGLLEFNWTESGRPIPAPFSALFEGEINLTGPRTDFSLTSDDGSYLEIDGVRIIDNTGAHAEKTVRGSTMLQGWRKIKIGYDDMGGGAMLRLNWMNIRGEEESIPASALRVVEHK